MGRRRFWGSAAAIFLAMAAAMWWKPPGDSAGVAAWVQGLGSVAAIYGAVWGFSEGALAQRRQQMAAALVTASVLVNQLSNIVISFQDLKEDLQMVAGGRLGIKTIPAIQSIGSKLQAMVRPTEEQMLRMVVAPKDVLEGISAVLVTLSTETRWAELLAETALKNESDAIGEANGRLARFQDSAETVAAVQRTIMKFMHDFRSHG